MRAIVIYCLTAFLLCGCNTKSMQNSLLYAASNQKLTQSTLRSDEDRALILKTFLVNVDGIESVAVVIVGKTALIGIETQDDNLQEETRLKKLAEGIVRNADTDIKNVAISTNTEIFQRIKLMES